MELDWLLRRRGSLSWRQELVVDVSTAMEGVGLKLVKCTGMVPAADCAPRYLQVKIRVTI